MFRSDTHPARSGSAQVIDFIGHVPLFRMWRSSGDVRRENPMDTRTGREGGAVSFYLLKRNKRNNGTGQWKQALSACRIVPPCSALAVPVGRGGRRP